MGAPVDTLDEVMALDGAIAVAVVDRQNGFVLAHRDALPFDVELAAAAATEVVKAQLRSVELLGLDGGVEDVLVTLTNQHHLMRVSRRAELEGMFYLLVLDRSGANLALARRALMKLDSSFSLQAELTPIGALS